MEPSKKRRNRAEQRAARELAKAEGLTYMQALQQLRRLRAKDGGLTSTQALQQLRTKRDSDHTGDTAIAFAPADGDEPAS